MFANYHTHTYHCGHACGTPEEYVIQAIKNGIKELGFSDHNPCPYSTGHYSFFRMGVDEIGTYVEEISALKNKYADKIKIFIGFEMEYYPKEYEATMNLIKQYDIDYLILGQHFTKNEYDGVHTGARCSEEDLITYVKQIGEGMEKGVFSYIAHPDIIRFEGDEDIYSREIILLCKRAKELQIPLEFNLLGFKEKRPYPRQRFWEIASEVGNDVVIGCDAHMPEDVGRKDIYDEAVKRLGKYGIKPVKSINIRKII